MEDMLWEAGQSNTQGSRRYNLQFRPNGASNPTVFSGYGLVSIIYVSTGLVKLIMQDTGGAKVLGFDASVQSNAGGPAQGFSFNLDNANTDAANGIYAIAFVNNSAARADIASDANTMIYVELILSKEYGDQ